MLGGEDPHPHQPPRPPAPGEGLLAPALAGRRRGRPLPRLAGAHAGHPRAGDVRLVYGRNWADNVGARRHARRLGALPRQLPLRRRGTATTLTPAEPEACKALVEPRRWGAVVPIALLLLLSAGRLLSREKPDTAPLPGELYEKASKAYSQDRFDDAAEFSRAALELGAEDQGLRAELRCLRGESLLRLGQATGSVRLRDGLPGRPPGPHAAQALFGSMAALTQLGETVQATGRKSTCSTTSRGRRGPEEWRQPRVRVSEPLSGLLTRNSAVLTSRRSRFTGSVSLGRSRWTWVRGESMRNQFAGIGLAAAWRWRPVWSSRKRAGSRSITRPSNASSRASSRR